MSDSIISLRNVCKRYGRTQALDHLSLEVPEGVVFALLGENGAGKTTMIRILTGFVQPDSGSATVLGHSASDGAMQIRQSIGYVSDAPALYDWMKAEEIGWFTSAFYDDAFPLRYLELLAAFDVPTGVRLKNMSKGQRAKVALALATAHDPKLLILDEPTSGLDPMVRRQFLESMVDRAALGRTVLLSSHQISEVERVADWVAIVHKGMLKVCEPLETLRARTLIVTATLDHASTTVAVPAGNVLCESRNGRQMRWVVSDLSDDWRAFYGPDSGVTDAVAVPATLEEIFVAVCDDRAVRPAALNSDAIGPGMNGPNDRRGTSEHAVAGQTVPARSITDHSLHR
ncbi:putative ABC transporter ATP-binding protein YbhF [Rubripirellula lacrimiformis]|uniref:Putative ABC transporter ATP-binding protein YbhF n=1 Tax=Rubripirellula lacrimiformis TaxID=1930273 RepID=A0A517NEJ3_9BACT|nr:ABC transporter ATP-binding protein [Rubripirellula lacrimiformis]QDT05556.1 putative ABC transporter ATP-binding protein YbhF [Rubripirellula lacrimiformis]